MPMKKQPPNNKKKTAKATRSKLPLTYMPPPSKVVNFVSTYRFVTSEAGASTGGYTFLAINNPYDVLTAVGGPSPMGYSGMSTFYSKYRCDRVRVHVDGVVTGTANSVVECCLVPTPTNSTLPSSPENWRDSRMAVSRLTTPVNSASGSTIVKLDRQWNMWDLFGVSRAKYEAEDNYGAVTNGNPNNTMYCAITVYGWGGATAASFTGRYIVSFELLLHSPSPQNP